MEDRDIEIVQTTFGQLASNPAYTASLFYEKLFALYPSTKELFPEQMEELQGKFMQMLSYIVSSLDNLDELDEIIQDLGKRHIHYGVNASHYPLVGEALLATIKEVLAQNYTEKAQHAWGNFYGMLIQKMQ